MDDGRHGLNSRASQPSTALGGDSPNPVQVEVLLLAKTRHQHPGRHHSVQGVDQGHLSPLALNLTLFDQLRYGPVQGAIRRTGRASG